MNTKYVGFLFSGAALLQNRQAAIRNKITTGTSRLLNKLGCCSPLFQQCRWNTTGNLKKKGTAVCGLRRGSPASSATPRLRQEGVSVEVPPRGSPQSAVWCNAVRRKTLGENRELNTASLGSTGPYLGRPHMSQVLLVPPLRKVQCWHVQEPTEGPSRCSPEGPGNEESRKKAGIEAQTCEMVH